MPQVPIIMITGYSTVDTAVEALKNGAVDYIAKPFTPEHLLTKIAQAIEQRTVLIENICLQKELREHQGFNGFIGTSPEMQKVYRRITFWEAGGTRTRFGAHRTYNLATRNEGRHSLRSTRGLR